MDELTIGDKIYISSKRAAKITGYAKDYVGQLCREGRVEARLVGRNWYVLESSIKEHRFGESVEEGPKDSSVNGGSIQAISKISEDTWSTPRYEAEIPETVPALLPKQEPFVSRRVVSDMQSAWQEWFSAQKPATELLSDGAEDFNGTQLPALAEEEPVETQEYVHIRKIGSVVEPISQEEATVSVPLHRLVQIELPEKREAVLQAGRVSTSAQRYEQPVKRGNSSLILKSVFLGVAMLAAVVALIGTGTLADLLKENSGESSSNALIQYLGGQSEFDNI